MWVYDESGEDGYWLQLFLEPLVDGFEYFGVQGLVYLGVFIGGASGGRLEHVVEVGENLVGDWGWVGLQGVQYAGDIFLGWDLGVFSAVDDQYWGFDLLPCGQWVLL